MGMFDHIKEQTAAVDAVRFEFEHIAERPWLLVTSATESNRALLNASLRRQNAQRRGFRPNARARRLTAQDTERQVRTDIEMFSKYVVKDWGNVMDPDGNPVAFTEEHCQNSSPPSRAGCSTNSGSSARTR